MKKNFSVFMFLGLLNLLIPVGVQAQNCDETAKAETAKILKKGGRAKNIKVGVKIKSYGTLATWTLDSSMAIGNQEVPITMAGYYQFDRDCNIMREANGTTTGDGVIVRAVE